MSHDSSVLTPWYKQPWLWFILSPILAAMTVAFVVLLPAAIKQQQIDPPLEREFIRDGRGYAVDESMTVKAKEMDLYGELQIDLETGQALLDMHGNISNDLKELELHIKVGANQQLDHVITLRRIDTLNQFTGSLVSPITARSTFIILSPQEGWKMLKDARPPFSNVIAFTP